jgi:hypothetical protein
LNSVHWDPKKIRSYPPDPPNPFSHRITFFQSRNY